MTWHPDAPQGNEDAKIKWELPRYTRGVVLDLGAGTTKPWAHFVAVDSNRPDSFQGLMVDIKRDCQDLSVFASGSWDAVYSSHLLEHLEDTEKVLREWWRVVRAGGHLVLYLPHKDLYPNIGQPGSNPDHKHDFLPEDIIRVMEKIRGWDLLRNEVRAEENEYSFFQVYRKRSDKECNHPWKAKGPKKTAAVVRYGGFGDMLQVSSVLPGLKRQGFHVTMYTTESGREILKADPHIDDWYIQDVGQVPLDQLHLFFQNERKKYDRFVNLTESVETSLLPSPGMSVYFWPKEARHRLCNHNYLEIAHLIAGVPYKPELRFYATKEEQEWARKERAKIPGKVILWSVAGSSVHKVWPWTDSGFARIMLEYKDWQIVMAGNEFDQIIGIPWREQPRIIDVCGKWTIRQTLAFIEQADMVIGPETGILNAAGFLHVPKIIFLSHSTMENLTRDWINAISLVPDGCECYPCHKLHLFSQNDCTRDEETGTTACQVTISIDSFMAAFRRQAETAREDERAA